MTVVLSPMLVSEIPGHRERIMSQPYVFVQPKLNGWCCMANTITRRIYTRNGNEITTLPHINRKLPHGGPEWLHGELYKHGVDLDVIQSMIKLGSDAIEFHVFDCVSDEGFMDRSRKVASNVSSLMIIKVPTIKAPPHHINLAYNAFLSQGYEGIIIRLDGAGYEHHRSINVFKMKPGTEVI